MTDTGDAAIWRALELAWRGLCTPTPNPRVGCVIVPRRGGDEVVGEGWHERAGGHMRKCMPCARREYVRAVRRRMSRWSRVRIRAARRRVAKR